MVNVASGNLLLAETDLVFERTATPRPLRRVYNSRRTTGQGLGAGWSFDAGADVRLRAEGSMMILTDPSGYEASFVQEPDGSWRAAVADTGSLERIAGGWRATTSDGRSLLLDAYGRETSDTDRLGTELRVDYTSANGQERTSSWREAGGFNTRPTYDGRGLTRTIDDPASRHFYYDHDAAGRLVAFEGPTARSTYTYGSTSGRVESIAWPASAGGSVAYDSSGRVTELVFAETGGEPVRTTLVYGPAGALCPGSAGSTNVKTADGPERTFCWDANFATNEIKVAPSIESEPFADREDDFAVGSILSWTAGVQSDDGVREVSVSVDADPQQQTVFSCTTVPSCAADADVPISLTLDDLDEGEHNIRLRATAVSGGVGEDVRPFYIDRSDPEVPRSVELFGFDEEDRTVGLHWDEGEDPDLGDGSPGSGLAETEFRVAFGAGSFGSWRQREDDSAVLDGADLGDELTVELRSVDQVGNKSRTIVRQLEVTDSLPDEEDVGGPSTAQRLGPNCRVRRAPTFKKAGSRLLATFGAGCVGKKFSRVSAKVIDTDPGIFDPDDVLDEDRVDGPRSGYVTVAASAACRRGREDYKAEFILDAPAPSGRSEFYKRTIRRTYTCTDTEDEEANPCLRPGATYRSQTRTNFRYNLCVRTKRLYSGKVAQAHHMLPVAFESTFRRRGISNIHDPVYGVWWRQPDHSRNAYQYNRSWAAFLRTPRSVSQIRERACELADDYNLDAAFCGS